MPSVNTELLQPLIKLYIQLGGGVLLGWVLGCLLPKRVPTLIGQFLFWIGVPVSIITFLRGADLSGAIWIAPVMAWIAILLGAGLAWSWIKFKSRGSFGVVNNQQSSSLFRLNPPLSARNPPSETCIESWRKPAQGSFLNTARLVKFNTGDPPPVPLRKLCISRIFLN